MGNVTQVTVEVTANVVAVATRTAMLSAAVVNAVITANAAKTLRDAAVVMGVAVKPLNASVMNTTAAIVVILKPKRVNVATAKRANVATAKRLKPQRRANVVIARRLSNYKKYQKLLSPSAVKRSQLRLKIKINQYRT